MPAGIRRRTSRPRVLIGYSTCPHTRAAFEAAGCEVWTCDLRPDPHPNHHQCDIRAVAEGDWDAGVFHPTCTYLTVSAAWAYGDPDFDRYPAGGYHQKVAPATLTGAARRAAQAEAIAEVAWLDALPYPTAIENPGRSYLSKALRPPDCLIQPYEFGEDASKLTGFWLDRLPPLLATGMAKPRCVEWPRGSGTLRYRWSNQTDSGQNRLTPSDTRWLDRSRTYPGIAAAMGAQWGRALARCARPDEAAD